MRIVSTTVMRHCTSLLCTSRGAVVVCASDNIVFLDSRTASKIIILLLLLSANLVTSNIVLIFYISSVSIAVYYSIKLASNSLIINTISSIIIDIKLIFYINSA